MYNPILLKAWFSLQVAGAHIGVPILLATLYFSPLKRLKTLYNLLFTWVFSGVISLML